MPTVKTYRPTKVSTAPIPGVRRTAAETETSTGAGYELARARKYQTPAGVAGNIATHASAIVSREAEEERLAADQTGEP